MTIFWNDRYKSIGDVENTQIDKRIEFKVIYEQQEKATNRLLISSLLGSINLFVWEGFLYKEGKPEKAKPVIAGPIHPFLPDFEHHFYKKFIFAD